MPGPRVAGQVYMSSRTHTHTHIGPCGGARPSRPLLRLGRPVYAQLGRGVLRSRLRHAPLHAPAMDYARQVRYSQ